MSVAEWIIAAGGLWGVWAGVVHALIAISPRREALSGLAYLFVRVYARLMHRLRVEGREHIPRGRFPGPLIVVSNHTAGIDPLLIQSVCPFEITWIMAEDMRLEWAEPLWEWIGIIFIDREGGGEMTMRTAMRRLHGGAALGIFPEGRIERPTRTVLPFMSGVGMLARRRGAPVLPIIIDGTPEAPTAWGSLWTPSRTRIRVMAPIRYDRSSSPAEIAEDLRLRYLRWTGWSPGDGSQAPSDPPPPETADNAA